MSEGWRPTEVTPEVTPSLRSEAAAESARLQRSRNGRDELPKSEVRGGSQEELPRVRGQGQWPGGPTPHPRPWAVAWRSYHTPPRPRPGAAAWRSYPTPEARGHGQEDQPHIQGGVAVRVQEGLEELSHAEGQEGWW